MADHSTGLRLAFAGKGGVGKTTLTALLAHRLRARGWRVAAIDADPARHLAAALGLDAERRRALVPISRMKELIKERTGSGGGLFSATPKVDDLLERFGVAVADGVLCLEVGTVETAGSGCFCPESALLRALLRHLVMEPDRAVLIDLEAGLEPMGRSTIERVDRIITVVEPGMRSIETAARVRELAHGLGVERVGAVSNRVRGDADRAAVERALEAIGLPLLAHIPFEPALASGDLEGRAAADGLAPEAVITQSLDRLLKELTRGSQEAGCRAAAV